MYSKYCVHWPSLDKLWSQGSSLPYSPGIGLLVIGQRVQHLPSARRFWASNVPTRGLLEGNLKIMQFSAVLYQSTADNPPPPNKHESLTRWHSTINVEDIYIYVSRVVTPTAYFPRMKLLVDFSREWSCSLTCIYQSSLQAIKVCGDNVSMLRFESIEAWKKVGWLTF